MAAFTRRNSRPSDGAYWAWQFLRRNKEYRDFWAERVFPFIEEDGSFGDPFYEAALAEMDRTGAEKEVRSTFGEANHRFGLLIGPHDPRRANPPLMMEGTAVSVIIGSNSQLRLAPHQVAYVIDLRLPIAGQFARAEEDARTWQASRSSKLEFLVQDVRMRREKFVQYLRLIDGEDFGATDAEIGAVLFADKKDEYPDRARSKSLEYARGRAHELRDGDYRLLAAAMPGSK